MGFVESMAERGLVAQLTHEEELKAHLKEAKRTAYVGFDPTASSLHVGHLFPVMMLARWQRAGHRAVALMGGGTALVGDPTGKTEMRRMLSEKDIDANIAAFEKQVTGLLDLSDPGQGVIKNNADWLCSLEYVPFLREVGSHFSVNRMLTAECFKARMEHGLSFLEFNYMVMQAYDFLHLSKTEECTVQLGGDDQWSNMLAGMDLIRRISQSKAYCLTNPLLTTSDGRKMGKTEGGAVWLDPNLTKPYEYFQYWRNVTDDMVGPCLKYFTFLDTDEIGSLENAQGSAINESKTVLAYEATKLVHGEEEAKKARESASSLFGSASGDSSGNEPEFLISADKVGEEIGVLDLLTAAGVFEAKGEVRRLIAQNGLEIDGKKVADPKQQVGAADLGKGILVKKGKKHYYRVKIG